MKLITISEPEKECIESFVQEVSNIPVAECIYMVPYFNENEQREEINIIVIWNMSLYYNGLLTGKEEMRFDAIMSERESLDLLIKKYNNNITHGRLSFTSDDSSDYSLSLMHGREWIAEQAIASGTILFDRFGNKTDNKKSAERYFAKAENVLQIESIEQLVSEIAEKIEISVLYNTNKDNSLCPFYVAHNGRIINTTYEQREYEDKFAHDYCVGEDNYYLYRVKRGFSDFGEFKRLYHMPNINDPSEIDEFMHSQLNDNEKKLLKEYLDVVDSGKVFYSTDCKEKVQVDYDNIYDTFLISVLHYDKIDPYHQIIYTTSTKPELRFKNYISRGYEIIIYNSFVKTDDGEFVSDDVPVSNAAIERMSRLSPNKKRNKIID